MKLNLENASLIERRVIKDVIHPPEEIDECIRRIAVEFREETADLNPLLVGVALGGTIFTKRVVEELKRIDPGYEPDLAYITAGTYHDGDKPGVTKIHTGLRPVDRARDRYVYPFDELVDKRLTGAKITSYMYKNDAASVNLVTLGKKKRPAGAKGPEPLINGFDFPDEWLLGMGMDWHGLGRNLGFIAIMDQEAIPDLKRDFAWLRAA